MKILCIDGDPLTLKTTVDLCRELSEKPEVTAFPAAAPALLWLKDHAADVALLETDLPDMNGLELAARMREIDPNLSIVFLSGYSEYAVEAFRLRASGYLLKPLSKKLLAEEIGHAMRQRRERPETAAASRVTVQTFGEFDLFVDGRLVSFSRAKSKELLAYLVDRQGGSITRATAFAVLWEDGVYDRSKQKQLDVIIRSLRATLASVGADEIFDLKQGALRVRPETMNCDLYRFLNGDADAVNRYRGEYMSAYSWGSLTEAFLARLQRRMRP